MCQALPRPTAYMAARFMAAVPTPASAARLHIAAQVEIGSKVCNRVIL